MKSFVAVCLMASWAVLALPTRAQFVVNTSVGSTIGNRSYFYEVLTLRENTSIVAARSYCDTCPSDGSIEFLRSTDGGHTWAIQDPKLSLQTRAAILQVDLIDSMHVVALGKYGSDERSLLVRTIDGGMSWQALSLPTALMDLSFSSPTNGILVKASMKDSGTFLTSDGGEHWKVAPFTRYQAWHCHDYARGMYREFIINTGEIYTTHDSWTSFDSTQPIVRDAAIRSQFFFTDCQFSNGDTLIAYGYHRTSPVAVYPCIARSTNAGGYWSIAYDDTIGEIGGVARVSNIDRDTILAGLNLRHSVLVSTNNGSSWKGEPLVSDDSNFLPQQSYGIALNASGELLGAFSYDSPDSHWDNWLVVGTRVTANALRTEPTAEPWRVYPNPTKGEVTILGARDGTIRLFDLLGRQVLTSRASQNDSVKLDCSGLSPGLYFLNNSSEHRVICKE